MNSSKTDLVAIVSSESPSVFLCPFKPIFTWILTETAAFYIAITTKSIACPFTVLLNILVIVAVAKRRALQKNSNILLASMAVADFLVGAVSMPITTVMDVLLIRKELSLTICKLAFANQMVQYGAVSSSFFHLTVIAWERYVAIKKWKDYRIIVTRTRVKICAVVAWLLAIITTTPVRIMKSAGVDYKYLKVLNIISGLNAVVCIVLIGVFYILAYLGVRSRKTNDTSTVDAGNKAKLENTIAKATGIITVVLLVFYIPSIVVFLFGEAVPFLRTSSFFRWSELLIQLNSLVNPILYCFALNRNFRKEVLEMMKIRKPAAVQPEEPSTGSTNLTAFQQRARRTGETKFFHFFIVFIRVTCKLFEFIRFLYSGHVTFQIWSCLFKVEETFSGTNMAKVQTQGS